MARPHAREPDPRHPRDQPRHHVPAAGAPRQRPRALGGRDPGRVPQPRAAVREAARPAAARAAGARDVGARDDPPREGPAQAHDRGRLGDQVPPHRGVPRDATTSRSRTRASRCSTSRTTTSPAPGRSTTCSSGAARSSASSPTRRSTKPVNTPPQTHPGPAARRVHQAGQGTQARLHRRLGAPEAQRPGAAHRALQGPVQVARRARRAADRVACSRPCDAVVPDRRGRRRSSKRAPACSASRSTSATAPERAYVADAAHRDRSTLGDRVVVNTTAVELGLGTGGWHVVHWNLARDRVVRARARATSSRRRYTSLQADVGSTEEHCSRRSPTSTRSTACPSSRPRCTASCPRSRSRSSSARPDARLAYVMTDGAALPLALSDLVAAAARHASLLDATITCGHAFGGDYEAVSVYSRARGRAPRRARRRRRRRDGARDRRHRRPGSASPASRSARSSTPRPGSAACRSRACACRSPTRARATAASRTTARPRCTIATPQLGARPARRRSAASDEARLRADLAAPASTDAPRPRRRRARRHRRRARRGRPARRVDGPARGRRPGAVRAGRGRGRVRRRVHDAPLACAHARRSRSRRTRPEPARAAARHPRRADPRRASCARSPAIRRSSAANRRAFERDKEVLRGMGVPHHDRDDRRRAARSATASSPDDYYLPDLGLDAEESRRAARRGERGLARQPARARAR